ncbi:hypothetical protein MT390_10340 [Vibrio sp. 2-Bac 85]
MSKVVQTQMKFVPNSPLLLNNNSGNTMSYQLDFGEYGNIEIDIIAGSTVTINQGTKPCVINILETKQQPGISGIVKNKV